MFLILTADEEYEIIIIIIIIIIIKLIYIMSFWLDLSSTSNKIKQSYFKGFIDVSGGGVNIRSDNSLNFFNLSNYSHPTFSIKSDKIYIYNPDADKVIDISNEQLL